MSFTYALFTPSAVGSNYAALRVCCPMNAARTYRYPLSFFICFGCLLTLLAAPSRPVVAFLILVENGSMDSDCSFILMSSFSVAANERKRQIMRRGTSSSSFIYLLFLLIYFSFYLYLLSLFNYGCNRAVGGSSQVSCSTLDLQL